MIRLLSRSLILIFLMLMAGRMLTYGLSAYYLDAALDSDSDESLNSLLAWDTDNSKGLYLKSKRLEESQPDQALHLSYQAINNLPMDMRPLLVLVRLLSEQGGWEKADRLVSLSTSLMPANKSIRLRSAAYWVERNQLSMALSDWSVALDMAPSLGKQLFPVLLKIAEHNELSYMLKEYAINPPIWWESFFRYLATHVADMKTIRQFGFYRRDSVIPISENERKILVDRLIKDKAWEPAYLFWVEGLDKAQRRLLSGIYDGSFELKRSDTGFDWKISSTRQTRSIIKRTFGADGERALNILFDDEELRFRHISQTLFLPSGHYQFNSIKRSENITGRGRLKWKIYCINDMSRAIAESRHILPSRDWESMSFNFSVPVRQDCDAQMVRLESVGKHLFDHRIAGNFWFDKIRVHTTTAVRR